MLRLQRLSKTVSANNWILQGVQQGIPDWRTSHTKSLSAIGAEPVVWYNYELQANRRCCHDVTPATGWHNSVRYGGAWPCRVCTWLALEHPANVARYGGVVTSLGGNSAYCWPHRLRHSTLIAVCWSSLSVHPPGEHCNSQHVAQLIHHQIKCGIIQVLQCNIN